MNGDSAQAFATLEAERWKRLNGEEKLLTVKELAAYLQVSENYVYSHANELGALRLPTGGQKALRSRGPLENCGAPRGRLRFDLAEVRRLMSCQVGRPSEAPVNRMVEPRTRSRARRPLGARVELLPVRGDRKG